MRLFKGRFRSRKARKRATTTVYQKSEGLSGFTRIPGWSGGNIVDRVRQAFGASKHRSARVARYQARQRRSL